MINEYYRERKYEKIAEIYQEEHPAAITDADIINKVAESYRRIKRTTEAIRWLE